MKDEAPSITKLRPPPMWQLWNNPIFRRYFRSRLRPQGLSVALIITLVIGGFIYLFVPAVNKRIDEQRQLRHLNDLRKLENLSQDKNQEWEDLARRVADWEKPKVRPPSFYERTPIFPLLILQGIILFLFGTGQVAGGMTAESDEGSVDYQRLAPMSPLAKTLGYLFGLPVREYVMFLATLPLTALALWKGRVPWEAWLPVYGVFLFSVVLYHLTGLVSGTVIRNKRWAFLLSMGLVFMLYTVVPQGARFGFPFVKYLTLWPVLVEHAEEIAPKSAEELVFATGMTPGSEVPFFNLLFSDLAFTLLVQGFFILAMVLMVWRKWRRVESHLLSKFWGLLVFVWIQVLIIGNAVPMAEDGDLFPSQNLQRTQVAGRFLREMGRRHIEIPKNDPHLMEGATITFVFAINLLLVIGLLVIMMTPNADNQVRGLRRALRNRQGTAPRLSDESSALPATLVLITAGTVAWYGFQRSILGSHWFTEFMVGAENPMLGAGRFFLVLALTVLTFHAMLETKGGKRPFLAVIFIGIVPIMAAMIVQLGHREVSTTALWIAGISPFTQLAAATEMMMPNALQFPAPYHEQVRTIFLWWCVGMVLALAWSWRSLAEVWRERRNARAKEAAA